jgi:hypothetical protein
MGAKAAILTLKGAGLRLAGRNLPHFPTAPKEQGARQSVRRVGASVLATLLGFARGLNGLFVIPAAAG